MASPLIEQRRHRARRSTCRDDLRGRRRRRAAGAGGRQPADQRGEVHRPGRARSTIRAELRDGEVCVSIRDNGVGIDPAHAAARSSIRSRRNARTATDRRAASASAWRSCAAWSRRTAARSASTSDGTRSAARECVIRLPLPAARRAPAAARPVGGAPAPAGGVVSVLLVDDNGDAADMLADSLRALGHHVRVALRRAGGAGGRRQLRAGRRAARPRAAGDGRLRAGRAAARAGPAGASVSGWSRSPATGCRTIAIGPKRPVSTRTWSNRSMSPTWTCA